jgi:hypothetical protein
LGLDVIFFTSDTGSFTSDLRITSDDPTGNSDLLVPLSARSIAPVLLVNPTAFDFGNGWGGSTDTLSITNTGTDTLIITNLETPAVEFTVGISNTILPPDSYVDVSITFSPANFGYWAGPLVINSNAYQATVFNVDLKAIAVIPNSFDYGQVLLNRDSAFVQGYVNGGNTSLVIDSVVTTHPAFTIQLGSNAITPGQTLEITTIFTPQNNTTYTADEILYTSQIGSGFTIAQLTGDGITYPQSDFLTKSLSVVTFKGNDTQFAFDLSNLGDYPLDYTIEVDADWYGYTWLEVPQSSGQIPGTSTTVIDVNVINASNLDPGNYLGWLYFNTNSGTIPEQIVRTDTVDVFLNLLTDDTQLSTGSMAITPGNPDPVILMDDENNSLGLILDFITSEGGTVNGMRINTYPPVDSATAYSDPSGLITNVVYAHEYFEITCDIPSGYVVDVGFDYTHLPGILNPTKLRLARRISNAGTAVPWEIVEVAETEIDQTSGLVMAKDQTQLSQWVMLSNVGENLFVDVLAPVIGAVNITPPSPGILDSIVITANITDETGVDSASLFYAVAGEWIFSELKDIVANNVFTATIPGSAVTPAGVVFYLTARDPLGYTSISDTVGIEVQFPSDVISTSSVTGSAYSSGIPKGKWRLIAPPAVLDNTTTTDLLGDELGPQKDEVWRLFAFDPVNQTYSDNPIDFRAGEAYWLYQRVAEDLQLTTPGGTTGSFAGTALTLKEKWNLISGPYPFPVSITLPQTQFYGPITYGNNGEGWSGVVTELLPWAGYAVYNKTAGDRTIFIDPIQSPGRLAKVQVEEGWLLNVVAVAGEYVDRSNTLGCLRSAEEALDYHDNPELLAPGNYLSVTYANPAWGLKVVGMTSDIRGISADVQIWELLVAVKGISEPVRLSWDFVQPLPPDQIIKGVDLVQKKVMNLQVETHHQIGPVTNNIPYRLKVVSGTSQQVEQAVDEILKALPEKFTLAQNYPNPFNPITTLKFGLPEPRKIRLFVVNILGQEVAELADGWFDLGYHQVTWNSRDGTGKGVASGIYFAVITSGQEARIVKMMVVK